MGGGLGGVLGVEREVPAEFPFGEGAGAPIVEVQRGEGAVVELLADDGPDFVQRVEPFDDGFGGIAVEESLVDLLADGFGQAADSTGVGQSEGLGNV